MNNRRIYVASSWRNDRFEPIIDSLRSYSIEHYNFRKPESGPASSLHAGSGFSWRSVGLGNKPTVDEYRTALTHPISAAGYLSDMRAMEWATTCLLVLPCGRSAHLEAGWFAGRGKELLILTQDGEEPELMALMANHIFGSEKELFSFLTGRAQP